MWHIILIKFLQIMIAIVHYEQQYQFYFSLDQVLSDQYCCNTPVCDVTAADAPFYYTNTVSVWPGKCLLHFTGLTQ